MAQYYTLDEAARLLNMGPDDVKALARKGELRPFQDRGTMRFRATEVDELARRRGLGSDIDLPLGAAADQARDGGVFNFELGGQEGDSDVPIGKESVGSGPSASKKPGKAPPKPGSDSDVRLVADGSDLGFEIKGDSDVKVVADDPPASKSGKRTGSKKPTDSGAKLAGDKSDSDVRLVDPDDAVSLGGSRTKSASDSDVRLDLDMGPSSSNENTLIPTEEIDLDQELRKFEQGAKGKPAPQKPKSGMQLPTQSPFELSSDEVSAPKKPGKRPPSSGSDFDLNPESSSEFDLGPLVEPEPSPLASSSEEASTLDLPPKGDDEVGLGELKVGGGDSGINLMDPADSGISLEQSSGSDADIEFELSLEGEGNTPKPNAGAKAVESDSDSEFELTLDDSGGLAPLDDDETPTSAGAGSSQEGDIFETDFDVPAMDDESGSQAVALEESDTDLESSDFDLALDDQDAQEEDPSGSQVVALEEDDSGEARGVGAVGDVDEMIGDEDVVAEDDDEAPVYAGAAAPTEWGLMPALTLLPCMLVLFVVGLMGFELIRGMWGYRTGTPVAGQMVDGVTRMFVDEKALPPKAK